MSNSWMGALELLLVFGAVIGWAVWELVKLRRDDAAARRREEHAAKASPPAPDSPGPD